MTGPHTQPGQQAAAAAQAAGVRLAEVGDLGGFETVQRLFEQIWRPAPDNPPVTAELLRALTKAGNYVAAAYQGQRMVGASVAFFGPPAQATMHSHIAGVEAGHTARGVGYALKLHQRAWALERGVSSISWTFDPLLSRNAYFNLVKLGAQAAEYLPDFYGSMHDGINAGDESDRLLVRWDLTAPLGSRSPDMPQREPIAPAEATVVALGRDAEGNPAPGSVDGQTLLVAVPTDAAVLRETDAGRARNWRSALREVLGGRMAAGDRVTGFDRAGWYVLRREDR